MGVSGFGNSERLQLALESLQLIGMREGSTTVHVSRRTYRSLSELAERRGHSVSDLLEQLKESARRGEILDQYNTRMGELLWDPAERATWHHETVLSEVSAAGFMREGTAPGGGEAAAGAR